MMTVDTRYPRAAGKRSSTGGAKRETQSLPAKEEAIHHRSFVIFLLQNVGEARIAGELFEQQAVPYRAAFEKSHEFYSVMEPTREPPARKICVTRARCGDDASRRGERRIGGEASAHRGFEDPFAVRRVDETGGRTADHHVSVCQNGPRIAAV
jgi:hypothetical protein